MIRRLNWLVGPVHGENGMPEEWACADVPGNVQLDWAKAKGYAPYEYAENFHQFDWMEEVGWVYRTRIEKVELLADERLFFVSGGIDYQFDIRLNGCVLCEQEGMFTPVELDLTGLAHDGDELTVHIAPPPRLPGVRRGAPEASQCVKPAVSYGWDWHPRLIPSGIWQETGLEVRPARHIRRTEVRYALTQDFSQAELTIVADVADARPGDKMTFTLADGGGHTVASAVAQAVPGSNTLRCSLPKPALWWPNGQGEQSLYRWSVTLRDGAMQTLHEQKGRVGLRRVQLVMNEGEWEKPEAFPTSRSNPPITMQINGRRIFCKGSNWVNPDIFPGRIDEQTYRSLLQLARDAHMNLLRCWGGAIVNKEPFFDLCDELGLMVWQEFPLACNDYAGTPHYLSVLDRESRGIIARVRNHPSLVLWCGGNELFNHWSRMTDQSLALRLLNKNCYELDPETPFLMTSPLMGMGHGGYTFRDPTTNLEVHQTIPLAGKTAYTEFGIPGPSGADYIRAIIPEKELFPPAPGGAWEAHHAFHAWHNLPTWLMPDLIEGYFGPSRTLEELVERGQLLQCEGYLFMFEEARRQKPSCAMALNWCYNEPWPSAANNSIVNYPAIPKPAWSAVRQALRPVLASARVPKFAWQCGEAFTAELWMLNDSPEAVPDGRVEVWLRVNGERHRLGAWEYAALEPGRNRQGLTLSCVLPQRDFTVFTLELSVDGAPELGSTYRFLLGNPAKEEQL